MFPLGISYSSKQDQASGVSHHDTTGFAHTSLPGADRTVQILSDLSQAGKSSIEFLTKGIATREDLRSAVLEAINAHPSLLESPKRRGAILEAITPFSYEPKVQELAVVSLESTYLKNSSRNVTAACAIIQKALRGACESDQKSVSLLEENESQQLRGMSPALERRLLGVAARYTAGGGDLAAAAALHLIPATSIPEYAPHLIRREARAWFLARHQEKNPWLVILSDHPSRENLLFLASIVQGKVPAGDAVSFFRSLLKMPLTFHEVALTSAVVTVLSRQICAYLKIPKAVSNATIATLSAILVVGGKTVADAFKEDTVNAKRNWERIEAIARLAAIRNTIRENSPLEHARAERLADQVLSKASRSLMQAPLVREAARIALTSENLDPIELWNRAAAAGDFDAAWRQPQRDIRA